jgi:hypothetical protein
MKIPSFPTLLAAIVIMSGVEVGLEFYAPDLFRYLTSSPAMRVVFYLLRLLVAGLAIYLLLWCLRRHKRRQSLEQESRTGLLNDQRRD